jgi:dTDP-glucose 4,6-dehydratase
MIGSGKNPYQFISVFDCASACAAWKAGFPNRPIISARSIRRR